MTATASITPTATITATPTETPKPTETPTSTVTLTPLFWEKYPEGTPIPIQTRQPETSREDYRPWLQNFTEIDEEMAIYPKMELEEFVVEYKYAVNHDLEWIYDPASIALRVTGHPNDDNLYPDEISVYQTTEDRLIVFLLVKRCMDDSIASREQRIELVKENDYWRAEWYGSRWKCHPWRGHEDWGTELCN